MVVSKGGDYEGCTDGVCYHVGTDYSVQSGSKLYASSNGSVIIADPCSAENCVYEGNSSSPDVNRGYGSVLVIEYQYHDIPNVIQAELGLKPGDSAYFVYGHLQEINVDTGEHVRRDQVIGLTGDTGNSTAPHLHLEIRTGPSGYIPPGDMCGANNCFNKFDQDARYSYLLDLHRHNPADIHKLYFGE
jgi:murein DD-endopeptidase MepM/ murein hydrolase activator NlpD